MQRLWRAAALALLVSAVGAHPRAQPAGTQPTLLVVLVVDQMRAADLAGHSGRWRSGFRTLLDEGAHFTRAEYPFLYTATCAGHATIGSGTLPRTHGIVLNQWWDRSTSRTVTCTEDAASPHVSYGATAAGGNSGASLLVPSLGDELRRQRPGARIVSLALKARSAIALAGHGPGIVTWFDDGARSFVTSRAFSSTPVDAIRAFIERDSPASALGLAWALQEPDDAYRHGDITTGERPKSGWTAIFPHMLTGVDGADAQFAERWQKSPFSDAYLSRMATAVVEDLQLGRRGAADYLAVSFSALDLIGHEFGPDSREAEDLLLRLDTTIGALLQRLDALLGREGYVVALTADHGIAPVPEQVRGGRIASEDVLQLLEQTIAGRWGEGGATPYVAWVGPGSVYFANGVYDRLVKDEATFAAVTAALRSVPGVDRVLRREALADARPDQVVRAALAGNAPRRSGDLLFVPRRHWIYELRSENDATNHGTLHDYDRRVPLVLRGHRIRPGRYGSSASPADIVPTLARLAGIEAPKSEGRPLIEAIR